MIFIKHDFYRKNHKWNFYQTRTKQSFKANFVNYDHKKNALIHTEILDTNNNCIYQPATNTILFIWIVIQLIKMIIHLFFLLVF